MYQYTDGWRARYASRVMHRGGVIAHPTEAVWGLACDPLNPEAVARLLALKHRPMEKGLILVSGYTEHFDFLTRHLSSQEKALFLSPREHPTTWLLPDVEDIVPGYIKGTFSSVAVRVSTHPLIKQISQSLGYAYVSTSANPSSREPAMSLAQVRQYFWGKLDYLFAGKLGGFDRPSQILDIKSNIVHRG